MVSVLILSVWTSFCINFSVWTVSVLIFPFERLLFKFFHLNGFCFNFSVWTDALKFSVWTVSFLIFLFERFLFKFFHLNKFQFSFFRLNGFCFNFCVWTVSVFIFSVWTVSVLQLTLIRKYRNKNNFSFMQLVQTNVGIPIIHHEIMYLLAENLAKIFPNLSAAKLEPLCDCCRWRFSSTPSWGPGWCRCVRLWRISCRPCTRPATRRARSTSYYRIWLQPAFILQPKQKLSG